MADAGTQLWISGEADPELLRRLGRRGRSPRPLATRDGAPPGDDEVVLLGLAEARADEPLAPARRLRLLHPGLPIVVVDPAGRVSEEEARAAGCDGRLTTEASEDEDLLREILRGAVERRALLRRIQALEQELDASKGRFQNTIQRVADGIVIVDEEGMIRFVNPAAQRLLGRRADDLVGEEFGVPLVAGETTELDLVRPDAEPMVAELRVSRSRWDDEPCLLVALRDVTARREAEERERRLIRERIGRERAEREARRSEFLDEANRRLFGSLSLPAILRELTSLTVERLAHLACVEVFRPEAAVPERRVTAARPGLELEEPVARLEAEDLVPCLAGPARRVMESGEGVRVVEPDEAWIGDVSESPEEADLLRSIGAADIILVPLATPEKPPLGTLTAMRVGGEAFDEDSWSLLQEVAGRAALALENARLYLLAQQANRARSDFLNVVSHELRTPLTGIIGYAGLLDEEIAGGLTSGQREYVEGIERNSDQLLEIIDQILLFADTEAERKEASYARHSTRRIVEEVASLASPLAERAGLEFRSTPGPDREVLMDASKIRQILLHLVGNAVKFTESGWVDLSVAADERELRLEVSDSGIGIPEEKHEEIFAPFTQVEEPGTRLVGGTGIGLSVVQNLTRLLGGSVEVESRPGTGSRFVVRLPVPQDDGGIRPER